MNIALLGYGKMGKEIEKIAIERGHSISLKIDLSNSNEFSKDSLSASDVAIDFSNPTSVYKNILTCFEANTPIVVGTTAWHEHFDEIKKTCLNKNQSLIHSSNFSIGANLFFELNSKLAQLMNAYVNAENYDVQVEEIHHTQKLDAPSGTGITIANEILKNIDSKKNLKSIGITKNSIINQPLQFTDELIINSLREENVPGTHAVNYFSSIDSIEIKHTAHNRKGFALGAVLAAEWLADKKGFFEMKDFLRNT